MARFLKVVPHGDRALDIGRGVGDFARLLALSAKGPLSDALLKRR